MFTNETVEQSETPTAVRVLLMATSPRFFDRIARHLQQACGWCIDRAPVMSTTPHADQAAPRYDVIVVDARTNVGGLASQVAAMQKAYAHQELQPTVLAVVQHALDGQAALQAGAKGFVRARALPEDVAYSIAQLVAYRTLHQAAQLAEARAAHLKAMHEISKTINAATDLRPILDATCRAAVELFGVDHSGLVLFEHATGRGYVMAEYPDHNCRGLVIPIRDVPFEERLINAPESLAIDDVAQWPEADLGPVAATFRHLGIRSILIVPIVCDGKAQGSFSLDWIERTGVFPPYVRELCASIAEQVAIALTKTRLLTESKLRISRRDELRRRTLAVTAQLDQQHLLQTVVREAAALLKTRSAGLYLYDQLAAQLRLVALHCIPTLFLGRTLRRGEGMAGQLLTNNKPYDMIANYRIWSGRADIYAEDCPYEAVLSAPLLAESRTIGVLFVEDQEGRNFNEHDGGYLRLFADAVTMALEKAELFEQRTQLLRISETLRRLGAAIQEQHDLDIISHIVLTGATANYALRFHRAVLLLLSPSDEAGKRTLDVQMAIGHLTEAAARADWEMHPDDEPDALERYLARLPKARRIATPLDVHLAGLRMPFDLAANDAFAQACREACVIMLEGEDLVQLPAPFQVAFNPAAPLLVAPLIARGRSLGLLVADAKFQAVPISSYQCEALGDLARTVALAIDNTSLLREAQIARDQLLSLFEASSALIDSTEPQRVLEDIVFRAKQFTNAVWVSVFIIDVVHGVPIVHGLVSTRKRPTFDPNQVVRPDGVTMQVLASKLPVTFEDTSLFQKQLHPLIFREGIGAAICLPLVRREQSIGVMWIHCRHARRFSEMERMALRLFVNQAVIAYDKTQQFEDLEQMRRAIESLAHIDRGDDARLRVVRQASLVLRAKATVLWIYDADSMQFLPGLTRTWNIPTDQWEQSLERAPRRSGTAFRMLTQRWLGVQDVQHISESVEIGDSTRDVMDRIGARSVQIINLQHGSDSLGVLYAFYEQPCTFDNSDKVWATTFAGYAAQTLKKAALLEQISAVRDAAELVASVSVREDIEVTLHTVAAGVRRVLGCDMIVIYGYDPTSETPVPMLTQEASGSDLTWDNGLVDDSVINAALRWRSTRVFPRVLSEPLLARARFVQHRRLESLAICPLCVAGEHVGVLIVGYRNSHRFSSVEEHTLDLFANQAAVALSNTRLYTDLIALADRKAQLTRRLEASPRILRAGAAYAQIGQMLRAACHELEQLLQDERLVGYASIRLYDSQQHALIFHPSWSASFAAVAGDDELVVQPFGEGICGWVALHRRFCSVPDVDDDLAEPHYRLLSAKPQRTRSEICVPILYGDESDLLGVLDVQSPTRDAFTTDHVEFLSFLAEQLAVIIHKATEYQKLLDAEQRTRAMTTLALTGSGSFARWHSTRGHAINIRNEIDMLRPKLQQTPLAQWHELLAEVLGRVERYSEQILQQPLLPPLNEQVQHVDVHQVIRERVAQLEHYTEGYEGVRFVLDLDAHDNPMVLATPEWLSCALDLLADNAAAAMTNATIRVIHIATRRQGQQLEISVRDTGSGIAPHLQERIFKDTVEGRTGVGLRLVHQIAHTYSGTAHMVSTGATGTTMAITFPLAPERAILK